MSLASVLKDHRRAAGLTQEELAERAGISPRTVSDVERGVRTRVYRDTAMRLGDALGLQGESRASFEQTARGRARQSLRSNLPIPPTGLIGRSGELAAVLHTLGRGDVRAVTITGAGGIGKTRLALAAASQIPFDGGVFFVPLGALNDASLVIPAIARAVGVPGAKEPTVVSIAEHLGDGPTLLVLDTMEHVVAAASGAADLLAACPGTTVLATSREAMRIRGEHEIVLPPLELPSTPSGLLEAPATRLFVERALAVRPDLDVEGSAEPIIRICDRVDGVPLAIELAAARVKHVTPDELADQLVDRFRVLRDGPRDLPRRQQTMRDTVGWSYDLLDEEEQRAFRDLCVFFGGWTSVAASAVLDGDVGAIVRALVDKSLVVRQAEDEDRYRMFDVVREFGLAHGVRSEVADAHLEFFLEMAERAEPELAGPEQQGWIHRLEQDHDNIRAALRHAIETRASERALRLAGALWQFWMRRGDLTEGRRWLREALAISPSTHQQFRSKAMWGAGWLAYHQGDYTETDRIGREMLQIASATDPFELRNALTICGIAQLAFGDLGPAAETMERCVTLLRAEGSGWLLATSLLNLGIATTHQRDPRSRFVLEEAYAMYVDLGDRAFAARTRLYAAYDAMLAGNYKDAGAFFRESLITFWELEDVWGMAEGMEGIASLAAVKGRPRDAARLASACSGLRDRANQRAFPPDRAVLERSLEQASAGVAGDLWRQWWAEGISLASDDAVDLAFAVCGL